MTISDEMILGKAFRTKEDFSLTKPTKPQSIRLALILLYFRVVISAAAIALNTRLLVSPTAEEMETYKLDQLTSTQIMWVYFNLLLPVLVAYLTIRFINRRQRLPAILGSLGVVWMSGSFNLMIELMIGVIIFILLINRSAREFFTTSAQPAAAGRAAGSANRVEVQAVRDGDGRSGESTGSETQADHQTAPVSRPRLDPAIEIREAGPNDAETIHALMMQAFEEYRVVIPPSSALEETVESVRDALLRNESAAILLEDEVPVAMVRYEITGDTIHFFRLSVVPTRRRRGYAKRLVKWIERLGVSKGLYYSRCKVRQSVQNNVVMYQNMGYEIVHQELDMRPDGTVKTMHLEKSLTL